LWKDQTQQQQLPEEQVDSFMVLEPNCAGMDGDE